MVRDNAVSEKSSAATSCALAPSSVLAVQDQFGFVILQQYFLTILVAAVLGPAGIFASISVSRRIGSVWPKRFTCMYEGTEREIYARRPCIVVLYEGCPLICMV